MSSSNCCFLTCIQISQEAGQVVWYFHLSQNLLFLFLNFYFYFILLYNTVLVLPYIDMNPHRVHMSSESWTPILPPIPYHLSGSSLCTSPNHPVSCIEHRPAIRFLHDSMHVSMPFSPILPPSHSPTEFKSPFYTFSQNFPQFIVIHTVKDFGIVNKSEIGVFLELSCFFDDSACGGPALVDPG